VLFFLHVYFSDFWGKPTLLLIAAIAVGAGLKTAEWLWLRSLSSPLKSWQMALLTWASITFNVALTSTLAFLTDKEDTPYFVLMGCGRT